ncbi:MerR family transcriptional regulator [Anatilimnocola floriformis]|uniref:MerR family transcriptional regulator n=1 Tax=Anatilimnocola floriformis TaxID=2948575 RepID=UPI0020C40640|nr:helix-turn-helix domain-containing protein [Anatilimnocola floriformis]
MSLLSPKMAAEALGVSESSLKRWVDQGVLTAVKTVGGHRRLETATLVDYARRSGRQIVKPELLDLGLGGKSLRKGSVLRTQDDPLTAFRQALLRGDESGCRFLARACLAAGMTLAEFGDRFVATSFHDVGDQWLHGVTEVYEERRACQVCHGVLADLFTLLPTPRATAPVAIGAAGEGDPYTLATSLVSLVLRQNGWRSQSLGNNLPWPTLIEAIRDLKPRLFWLSVSTIDDEATFVRNYRAFYAAVGTQTAVVVGGRAWTGELRSKVRFAAHCDSLGHLEAFAATLMRPARKKLRPKTP